MSSALEDNIKQKGKNAYYFAHAHKATGPKWDGKVEPRLLARHSTTTGESVTVTSTEENENVTVSSAHTQLPSSSSSAARKSFEYGKSNITKYAFLDEGLKLKIYIDFQDIMGCCTKDDVTLDWDEQSFCLRVLNYVEPSKRGVDVSVDANMDGADDNMEDKKEDGTPSAVANVPEVYCLSFGKLHGLITKATYKLKQNKIILILTKKLKEKTVTADENDVEGAGAGAGVGDSENGPDDDGILPDSDDEDEVETWPTIGAKGGD